jgi:hypothetical protein
MVVVIVYISAESINIIGNLKLNLLCWREFPPIERLQTL